MACGLALAPTAAHGQFPPPGGGFGMPPGPGMMPPGPGVMIPPRPGMPPTPGMPASMGMPPGAFGHPGATGIPADFPNPGMPSQEKVSPFSIKDEGMPNAFSELVDPRLCRPIRWQISAGYTFLWFNQGKYPPLATTGSLADAVPGALGQPGTIVLSTERTPGMSSAFRTTFTYWLLDPEALSLDANFFIMENRSVINYFQSDETGFPLLARPYFNVVGRQEGAELRSAPGISKGTMFDSVTTRLMGAEVNLTCRTASIYEGAMLNFLVGVRWLRLDERFSSHDTTADLGGVGTSFTFADEFATRNQFIGGQLGGEWMYRVARFTFAMHGKLAIGPNYQSVDISGQTNATNLITTANVTDDQGLYAQPTNVGTYRQVKTTYLPEFGARIAIDLSDRCRFNVGYNFLWLNHAVRPGDQMDRSINIQPLLAPTITPPLVPAPPTFQQSTFTAHMLNLSLEFMY